MDSDKIFLARAPPRPRFSINGITNVRLDSFLAANRVKNELRGAREGGREGYTSKRARALFRMFAVMKTRAWRCIFPRE